MAAQVKEYFDEKLVNIIGGCCGTTPEHIATYQKLIENAEVRKAKEKSYDLELSGLEHLVIKSLPASAYYDLSSREGAGGEVKLSNNKQANARSLFVNIGERCNVAGSKMFLR
jgi:5-methyltetrahydrofolate--homocysteine methyltransferase